MTSIESFWAAISFLLAAVVFQPIHTAFSDILGRNIALYECIFFFLIGSVLLGWAQNAGMLIAGRAIQGVGGGGLEALCEVVLTDITTLKERPRYIGLLGLVWASGSVSAPIVSGLFSEYVTWRWIAWINIPLMGIASFLLPIFLTLKADRSSLRSKLARVDWRGIILFMIGMTMSAVAIAWGGQLFPWNSWQTITPLCIGILVLAAFARYERIPKEPILAPRLFANRTSAVAFLGSFIHGMVIWCLAYFMAPYFQGAKQMEPFQAVQRTFPLVFTLTPSAIICALLIDALRRSLWAVWLGWTLSTIGLGIMMLLNHDSSKALYSGVQIAPGIGCGFLLSALAVPLQASMTVDDAGVAMGTLVFFRAAGSVVGVSVGSAIFTNQFKESLAKLHISPSVKLPDPKDAVYFIRQIKRLNIPEDQRASILQLYAQAIRYIWGFAAGVALVGLLSSAFMEELSLEREEQSRQALERRRNRGLENVELD